MGFQHLSKEERQRIQKMGGKTGGHRFSAAEAAQAGRKGGRMASTKDKSKAGRKGGLAKAQRKG